mmetsp:Transcript_6500/g.26334  ORF Transcript_6500/g.26334 Transcript_6500/m.26334 type:complete len:214 (-) Transcript_6500:329-970(-)
MIKSQFNRGSSTGTARRAQNATMSSFTTHLPVSFPSLLLSSSSAKSRRFADSLRARLSINCASMSRVQSSGCAEAVPKEMPLFSEPSFVFSPPTIGTPPSHARSFAFVDKGTRLSAERLSLKYALFSSMFRSSTSSTTAGRSVSMTCAPADAAARPHRPTPAPSSTTRAFFRSNGNVRLRSVFTFLFASGSRVFFREGSPSSDTHDGFALSPV